MPGCCFQDTEPKKERVTEGERKRVVREREGERGSRGREKTWQPAFPASHSQHQSGPNSGLAPLRFPTTSFFFRLPTGGVFQVLFVGVILVSAIGLYFFFFLRIGLHGIFNSYYLYSPSILPSKRSNHLQYSLCLLSIKFFFSAVVLKASFQLLEFIGLNH